MKRLIVHVEGQTEETFVNEVLAPHLYRLCYASVSARLIGNARQRDHRGGGRPWQSVKNEVVNHLKNDQECINTTMVDFYGLPADGTRGWPGRSAANELPFESKAQFVEEAIAKDLAAALDVAEIQRFVPFIVMYEYEGLLFSHPERFAAGIGKPELAPQIQAIRDAFPTPEQINDSPETAPSKRVTKLIPNYDKPLLGALAAIQVGLAAIRTECPHFNQWISRLEGECVE